MRPRIRWTAGLLRVWAAISCAWIVFAFMTENPTHRLQHRLDPVLIPIGRDNVEFPANTDPKVMRKALLGLEEEETKKIKAKAPWYTPEASPEQAVDEALTAYTPPESAWKIVLDFLLMALLPPLGPLGVGLVFRWIVRGFLPIPSD